MRICSVTNCGNSTFQLEKWKQQHCSKHKCHFGLGTCDCEPPFHLFTFPTEKRDREARQRWLKLINRKDPKTNKNWIAKSFDRVCSKHFPDGKPTKDHPDPCLHLGYISSTPSVLRRPPTERPFSPVQPKRKRTREQVNYDQEEPQSEEASPLAHDHSYTYKCDCKPNCQCPGCAIKAGKIRNLENRVRTLEYELVALKVAAKTKPKAKKQPIFSAKALKTDSDVNHCTGIKSKECMDSLFQYVEPFAKKMTYWSGAKKTAKQPKKRNYKNTPSKCGPKRKLPLKDEFVMVMMRLRLDLTVQFLALLFGVGQSTCSQVILTWIRFLAQVLKPLITWPDRGAITQNLPKVFRTSCRKLQCIIDCTEFFIQRPRSLPLQAATWSDYKKHNTIKVLVGITPTGTVCFLSKAYGGRASDVFITRKSGLLSLLDPGDVLMADRGFPIQEDLMFHQATLEIPPPAQGNRQMSRDNVKQTKKVANLRIHVERAIGRLKTFKILNSTMPITLVPSADDMIMICAALINLQPDLIV